MHEIGPGVYVETGFQGCNVGLIVTGEGAVLIDTPMMPWEAREWLRMIRRITDEKIRFVINTDHHPEHSLCNQIFSAPVIGHETGWKEVVSYSDAYRQRLLDSLQVGDVERDSELKALTLVTPTLTLSDRMILYLGDKSIQIIHMDGHASSSIVVYLKKEKIIFTGDLVVQGVHPVFAQSNTREWLSALNRIRRMAFNVLAPGQGEPGGKELTTLVSDYIRGIRSGVRRHYNAGHGKAETYNQLLDLTDMIPVADGKKDRVEQQFKAGINQVFEEIRAEKEG